MTIEKKTIRSDIPGHQTYLNGNIAYAGTPAEDQCRMIVGRGISINGVIASCDHLIVEGTVEAEEFSSRRLDILEAGLFSGTAKVNDAVIAGRFEGTLIVSGRLTVKGTGRISGEICYGALEVEAGARVEGNVSQNAPAVIEQKPVAVLKVQAPLITGNVEKLFDKDDGDEASEKQKGPRVFRRAVGF